MVEEGEKPFTRDPTVQLQFDHVGDVIWEVIRKLKSPDADVDVQQEFDESFNSIKSVVFKAIETTFDSEKDT